MLEIDRLVYKLEALAKLRIVDRHRIVQLVCKSLERFRDSPKFQDLT